LHPIGTQQLNCDIFATMWREIKRHVQVWSIDGGKIDLANHCFGPLASAFDGAEYANIQVTNAGAQRIPVEA
jgi:hypothetical protein